MSESPPARETSTRTTYILCALLVLVVLFGNSFLTSSGQGEIEGSKAWPENSILRDVAELLNLSYRFATPTGTEVKNLIFGIGAAVALILGALSFASSREELMLPEASLPPEPAEGDEAGGDGATPGAFGTLTRLNLTKLHGAQVLMAIAVGWSFMSANWASATAYALGGSVLMAVAFFWALGLGYGLGGRAIGFALRALIAVSVLTALLAIWYFYVRNPNQRAKYPIGNPLFLAAMLIPAFLLSITDIVRAVGSRGESSPLRRAERAVIAIIVIVFVAWTWSLTGSSIDAQGVFDRIRGFALFGPRATLAGLLVGLVSIIFFAGNRRARIVSGVTMGVLAVVGIIAIVWMADVSDYGRGATIRLRQYAWSYALDISRQRPWTGLGQGGYALAADAGAGDDALIDPEPFQGRLSHAHNEWLETLADLGALGFVFVIGSYILTFAAGVDALRRMKGQGRRWELIGLMAALLAMIVEEATNVALRLPGLPAIFFTVLGLTWAHIRNADEANETPVGYLSRAARTGIIVGAVAVAIVLTTVTTLDWQAARAQGDAPRQARSLNFDEALKEAEFAARWRLSPVRRMEAAHLELQILAESSAFHAGRAQERAARYKAGDNSPELAALAEADFATARERAQQGLKLAHTLRTEVSSSVNKAGLLEARLSGLLATLDTAAGEPESAQNLRQRAIAALTVEAKRHRLDEDIILSRLQLAPAGPIDEELELLIGPLRSGPFTDTWEQGARFLMTRPDFAQGLAALQEQAEKDTKKKDGSEPEYALTPEVLRMQAYIAAANQDFDGAADLAHQAADAYSAWGSRLVRGRIGALVEEARYRLFGDPANPAAAARAAQVALDAVPNIGRASDIEDPILAEQAHQYLAGFEEDAAAPLILRLNPGMDPEALPQATGRAYTGLAHRLLNVRQKPPLDLITDYLLRAIALFPEDPEPVRTLARVRFAQGDDDAVIALLLQMEAMTGDPNIVNQYLLQMAQIRDSETLRAFREARMPPTTQPATMPTSQPAEIVDDAIEDARREPVETPVETAPATMPASDAPTTMPAPE